MSCCEPGCEAAAEFQIIDKADSDPVTCYTEACEQHVGVLLGHAMHVPTPVPTEEWIVAPITGEPGKKT